MRKKIKIGLIIAIVYLSAIGGNVYFIQKSSLEKQEIKPADNEPFLKGEIECFEIYDGEDTCVEKSDFPKNAGIPLRVGRKFIYEVKNSGGSGTDTYTVEKIENIGGIDYYVVRLDSYFVDESGTLLNDINKAWYNKNTGEIIKIESKDETGVPIFNPVEGKVAEFMASNWNFAPWMLALTDDFEWNLKYKYNTPYSIGGGYKNYKVIGREKVEDRETFKVKITSVVNSKIDSEEYVWVDAQERILIKTSTGAILVLEN